MNAHSQTNRASRRVRASQQLATLIRDAIHEAEAELYIDGAVRCEDEAKALRDACEALTGLDESLLKVMQTLDVARRKERG